MATIKPLYGTEDQVLTITLASLANNAAQPYTAAVSAAIDNTTNLFLDAYIQVQIKTGATASGTVVVYVYGTVDFAGTQPAGPTYPEGITGAGQASLTLPNPTNLAKAFTITVATVATVYMTDPFSVVAALNLMALPSHWGIVVVNLSGAALDATASNHFAIYQGIQAQSV